MSFKRDNKSFKRDVCCFDFLSYVIVSIAILLNTGKEG